MQISPSILAADLTDLKSILKQMDPGAIDMIHMDVMDGHFVPAVSFGELYTRTVASHTSIPLDIHLMVENPARVIPEYLEMKPRNITFHIEATNFPIRISQEIRKSNVQCGVSLNPGTDVRTLEPLLDHIDMVLFMSVEPGFYGQKFLESVLPKIDQFVQMRKDRSIQIQVDGGVGPGNIALLAKMGVDIVVAGSAVFKTPQINDNARSLKRLASEAAE